MTARLILLGLLGLAACGSSAEPAPGVVERFTANLQRDEVADENRAARAADARAENRAEQAVLHIARSERERHARDAAAPEKQNAR